MKLHLVEPQRGYHFLLEAMKLAQNHPRIATFAPIGADIFLVIYPIFLIILYLRGIIKKQLEDKQGAIFIFLSCLISVATNIFLQYFFIKNRPQIEIIDGDKIAETLLDDLLPTSSFPSDHAVVGMSVAIATLIRGYKTKNKKLIYFAYFLIVVAIVMSACRVITAVHRPSDILGGFVVAMFIPLVLSFPPLFILFKTYLISPVVKFQEWIFSCFQKK